MRTLTTNLLSLTILTGTAAADPYYTEPSTTLDRMGVALEAGGGVEGFTDESMRTTTSDGGNWGVRATIGTKSLLGFEGAYIGSAQSIDALGLDNDAVLVGNGVQGALRLNATTGMELQPFVFAGVAWRHYQIAQADINTSDVQDSDDVLEVPMGVGLAYKVRGFIVDARGEYRLATENDLMPSLNPTDANDKASMHRWGVNANVGVEF